ncbi:hypothetical protein AGABI1DRAFT_130245 [Agaricus bisporus var. burnettii JB137-S8]|uniref:Uncharacterized protein n=1 Tax=Agaricus bisporus var. burnettii (strain JB137-S8 / ATCC MYA-4627 / FGSC 10392) TaxID=597362 RepID=K5XRN8_AGABU|nr:uncharacterized protein AGABI1DRAFT_130245 [Agaricus bisporus var. burnettii JB137-S8]EKM77550.1 hypothetical protein AGABI1DRAFT_130245 [Agaricus bisporus var. burnettii JB137-S8]
MRSATYESPSLLDRGRSSPSMVPDDCASHTESDDSIEYWNKFPLSNQEKRLEHAIWYNMENRGDDGEVGDEDGIEDEGEFEDPNEVEDREEAEAKEAKVRAELGNDIEGVKAEPEEVKAEPGNAVEGVKVEPEEVKAEPGNAVERVKVEPEEVKAEPGNAVERVEVEQEEAELPLFRRKRARSDGSEADRRSEPKLKKKKDSKVEVRLPKGVTLIKIVLKFGGSRA